MHIKFYMHEILTAAGNFYKIFPCNIHNLNAADIFQFLKKFSIQHLKFSMHISKYSMQSKLFIGIIYSIQGFSIVPPENFHMQEMFPIR